MRKQIVAGGIAVGPRGWRGREPGGEGEQRGKGQETWSVYGAVTTFPSRRNCRKSRQVPATGSSMPTFSCPGVVEVPVTRAPPSTLEQPLAPGAQTWVWK